MPILRFLRSVRLFIVLAAALIVLSILSTLSPGDHNRGATTIPVAVILILMEVNLVACTLPRAVARIRRRHHGKGVPLPSASDLIHVGLAIVLLGGLVTAIWREQRTLLLELGESAQVSGARYSVVSSRAILDDAGIVTGWEIDLDVSSAGTGETVTLRPNRPVRVPGARLHFVHWGQNPVMQLVDPSGMSREMYPGQGVIGDDGRIVVFDGIDEAGNVRMTRVERDGSMGASVSVAPGAVIGSLTYVDTSHRIINGFSVVRDPGRIPVLIGLLLIAGGASGFLVSAWRRYG